MALWDLNLRKAVVLEFKISSKSKYLISKKNIFLNLNRLYCEWE